MNKTIKILSGVLLAQVALAALTWTTLYSTPEESAAKPLFDFKVGQVVSLEITAKPSKEGDPIQTVKLAKKDDKWVVQDADGYPADKEKVDKVLDQLLGLKVRDPIARSAANHNPLKVGDREYGRKVTVKTASKAKSVILGSGAGSSVHVREKGSNDVYRSSGMSVWSIASTARGYIDTKYLEVDKDKLTQVMLSNENGQLHFAKDGDDWTLAELPPGRTLKTSVVKGFVNKMRTVNMQVPVGKKIKPEYGLPGAAEVVLVSTEDDGTKTHRYTIGAAKGEQFYLKADDKDYVVAVSKWDAKQARENKLMDFVEKTEEEKEAEKRAKEEKAKKAKETEDA